MLLKRLISAVVAETLINQFLTIGSVFPPPKF
jgi:hypothetical protein